MLVLKTPTTRFDRDYAEYSFSVVTHFIDFLNHEISRKAYGYQNLVAVKAFFEVLPANENFTISFKNTTGYSESEYSVIYVD